MHIRKSYFPYLLFLLSLLPYGLWGLPAGQAAGPAGPLAVSLFYLIAIFSTLIWAWLLRIHWLHNPRFSKTKWLIFIFLSILFVSFSPSPWLDDDVYRYMWDGFVQTQGKEPIYTLPSMGRLGFSERTHDLISFKGIPSVYPPIAQIFFRLTYGFCGVKTQCWSMINGLFYFLSCLVIMSTIDSRTTNGWKYVLLVLNPLIIKEAVDSVHVDIVGVFFLLLAISVDCRVSKRATLTSTAPSALLTSVAILVKPIAILYLPFGILATSTWIRRICFLAFVIFFLSIFSYFLFADMESFLFYLKVLSYFKENWVFNPGISELVSWLTSINILPLFGAPQWLLLIDVAVVISAVISLRMFRIELVNLYFIGIIMITKPVFNLWYLMWLIPAMFRYCIAPINSQQIVIMAPWALLFLQSLTSYLYYISLADVTWVRAVSWVVWFLVLFVSVFYYRYHLQKKK